MAHELQLSSTGAPHTRRIAAGVAAHLRPGDVVALTGELGAGKTCFVQGAAAALGVTERITSPSFVLRRDYQGRVPVVHLDVYRLDSLSEVLDLGMEEVFGGPYVVFVEWGDVVSHLLPGGYLEVEMQRADVLPGERGVDGDEPRVLRIRGHGPAWQDRLGALRADLCALAAGSGADGGPGDGRAGDQAPSAEGSP